MLSGSSRLIGNMSMRIRCRCTGAVNKQGKLLATSVIFSAAIVVKSKKISYADAAAVMPTDVPDIVSTSSDVLMAQAMEPDAVAVIEPEQWEWEWGHYLYKLYDFCRIFYRCSYLLFLFGPNIISSPLLLMQENALTERWWQSLRRNIAYAGPCIGKFAQWVSLRTDLFPPFLCNHLTQLQSANRVSSWTQIQRMLSSNLGADWRDHLEIIMDPDDPTKPEVLGSGCAGQVLHGKMRKNPEFCGSARSRSKVVASTLSDVSLCADRDVAVKLLHPGVNDLVEIDLLVLDTASKICEWLLPSIATTVSMQEHVFEFSKLMRDQLHMTVEAGNLVQFRKNFGLPSYSERGSDHEHDLTIGFPCPILATSSLLIEDCVHGLTLSEVLKQCDVETRKRMAAIGIHAVFKMVFVDNFIHADLHPGNILVSVDTTKTPTQLKLSFIDTGLVVQLEPSDARNFVDLFRAVVTNDGYAAGEMMIQRSRGKVQVPDKEEFSKEIQRIISEVHQSGFTLRELGLSEVLQKVLHLCYKHQVKLESRFASVIVAIGIIEGVGRELDPDIDILKMAVPYVVRGAVKSVKSLLFDFRHPKG